jgi:hypothetical protein
LPAIRIAAYAATNAPPRKEKTMKRFWILAAFAAAVANAQTLYKLIDKNGKVTYSQSAPKPGEFDGQVIRIDVNPNQNTAILPKLGPSNSGQEPAGSAAQPAGQRTAREKVEAARKALAQAQENPGEGDVSWIGNKGGGTRQVQSDEYKAKLAKLEDDVKQAEEELKRAEGR